MYSVDIVNGQVKTEDLASGAINLNIHQARGNEITLAPGGGGISRADCPSGEILTGGGFSTLYPVTVYQNFPQDENTWAVTGFNDGGTDNRNLVAIALCAGASP